MRRSALLLLAVLLPVAGGTPGSDRFVPFPVAAYDTHNQEDPASWGRFIAYVDDRDYPAATAGDLNEVYLYDADLGTSERLTHRASLKTSVRIDEGWMAWADDRNGHQDVYAMNLSARGEIHVASTPSNQTAPDLSYPWVVYQDDAHTRDHMDVHAHNLATGERRTLTPAEGRQGLPRISGDLVVWTEISAIVQGTSFVSVSQVFVHSLATGETRQVTNDQSQHSWPTVSAGIVVWQDERVGNKGWDLYAYEWGTGESRALIQSDAHDVRPRLAYPHLAWIEAGTGLDHPSRVRYWDLAGGDTAIHLDVGDAEASAVAVGSRFAAWMTLRPEGGDGAFDVWGAGLASESAAGESVAGVDPTLPESGPALEAPEAGKGAPGVPVGVAMLGLVACILARRSRRGPSGPGSR